MRACMETCFVSAACTSTTTKVVWCRSTVAACFHRWTRALEGGVGGVCSYGYGKLQQAAGTSRGPKATEYLIVL